MAYVHNLHWFPYQWRTEQLDETIIRMGPSTDQAQRFWGWPGRRSAACSAKVKHSFLHFEASGAAGVAAHLSVTGDLRGWGEVAHQA